MDELAAAHAICARIEIRRRNLVRLGSTTATGQVLRESVSAERVLDEALRALGLRARSGRRRAPANPREPRRRRGIGLALTWHGGGFTGGGEMHLAESRRADRRGRRPILIRVANVEMGQGAHTALAQIAAARLGLPIDTRRLRATRHERGAEQRSDGRVAHGDDRRRAHRRLRAAARRGAAVPR